MWPAPQPQFWSLFTHSPGDLTQLHDFKSHRHAEGLQTSILSRTSCSSCLLLAPAGVCRDLPHCTTPAPAPENWPQSQTCSPLIFAITLNGNSLLPVAQVPNLEFVLDFSFSHIQAISKSCHLSTIHPRSDPSSPPPLPRR